VETVKPVLLQGKSSEVLILWEKKNPDRGGAKNMRGENNALKRLILIALEPLE